ncbi:had-like protein [Lichtheimia corymbifera JMRC:FSU:9682]|uniref:Mitochondrial import inner membrane translocase subunit TIM50 n=1 Tax=Lichtheimia corymbifera JMRC:FSU:9682 TaxID=1263082 RepID=A0A068SGJ4_9FUNG|nr:had-like protein [Lichtheimia corymbifera JMRC:FSU:9682]
MYHLPPIYTRPPLRYSINSNNNHIAAPQLITSDYYLSKSAQPSVHVPDPTHRQLVILDLNGTLVSRINNGMYVRPYQDLFLDYLFKWFDVMVWSSAQPHSVANMCRLFGSRQPVCIWDRRCFQLSGSQYNGKFPTIKNLEAVWWAFDQGKKYEAHNTILIDDSSHKSIMQPYNAIHISTFHHRDSRLVNEGDKELIHVMEYLEELRKQSNVSNYIRHHPYKSSSSPSTTTTTEHPHEHQVYFYDYTTGERELVDLRSLVSIHKADPPPSSSSSPSSLPIAIETSSIETPSTMHTL